MRNKRIAYLVMDDVGDYVTDFHLSVAPLAELGWDVVEIPWRSGPDWDAFDAVYICTPWDYPQFLGEFLQVLETIDASRALLLNELETVRWNLEKSYMKDVEARGDDIVPSSWYDDFAPKNVGTSAAAKSSYQLLGTMSSPRAHVFWGARH